MTNPYEISDDTPVYVISVAAELSGLHPQTLRAYDRQGLVSPGRSAGRGRGRRYSLRDVLVLREVQRLSQAGVSLPGIKRIMELETELDRFRVALAEMAAETAQLRTELRERSPRLWNGISKVRVNLGTAIVGDPKQVTAELAAYWRLGIDEFILSGFPHVEECRRVASEVLPGLRAAIEGAR